MKKGFLLLIFILFFSQLVYADGIFLYVNPNELLTNYSTLKFNETNPPPYEMEPIYYYIDGLVVGNYQEQLSYVQINISLIRIINNYTFDNIKNYTNNYVFENFSIELLSNKNGYFYALVPFPGLYNVSIYHNNFSKNAIISSFIYFDYAVGPFQKFTDGLLTEEESESCQNTKFIIYAGLAILSLLVIITAGISLFFIFADGIDVVTLFATISGIITFAIIIFIGIYVIGIMC